MGEQTSEVGIRQRNTRDGAIELVEPSAQITRLSLACESCEILNGDRGDAEARRALEFNQVSSAIQRDHKPRQI